ncbi:MULTISPECIES: hypothetical protein [Bacillus cereus group]|uniref:Uncharacterized protein n=2 Tax=root TaxID=1 RepID=A0A1B1P7B8_9CAUD|nr:MULTISPECIES: hypothetical protein [Bacillus cereus group]YP_009830691.1 hypothetical protein HWA95_gp37 [Bacillus phage vB_BtS_BMBtp14]ANT39997.1 hypothetical protein BMBtpLA2_37 [Bacillus phage vB_BtS_BMBtp14]EEM55881.1 Permease [Bacillus thuringiensis serovar monterrey BGSC 4AJ1]MEB9673591.1 hypothetical protein [Bacillus anthracis]OTX09766.1 hypothetical protein BK705_04065 [Bacillus thuringiensis serovar monterrey]OTX56321.1 hypothetical protein BK724_00190 [Bacillus thuringiensis ser
MSWLLIAASLYLLVGIVLLIWSIKTSEWGALFLHIPFALLILLGWPLMFRSIASEAFEKYMRWELNRKENKK